MSGQGNTPPAQQLTAAPPTFRFHIRLVDDARLWDAARPNRFANAHYRLRWGPAASTPGGAEDVIEGTVDANGEIVAELDGSYSDGLLDVGGVDADGELVGLTIPLLRYEPPVTIPEHAVRPELAWRLHNLGFTPGDPWAREPDAAFAQLADAVNRFVFRHFLTATSAAERERYGYWRDAADEM